jgi:hypothetical protein
VEWLEVKALHSNPSTRKKKKKKKSPTLTTADEATQPPKLLAGTKTNVAYPGNALGNISNRY